MRKTPFLTALLSLAMPMLFQGCGGHVSDDAEDVYMVSIQPQRAILEALLDSGAKVSVMLARGSDPETFEPTMTQRMEADKALVYFGTGVLPFESRIAEGIDSYHDVSVGFDPIYGTHSHDGVVHDNGLPDPHYWTSVNGLRIMARNMAEVLMVADPGRKEAYALRLESLYHRLDSIDEAVADALLASQAASFAVRHPSLSYFARDYGLHQIVVGADGKEMSARQVREAIDSARRSNVGVFFIERQYDSGQAKAINGAIGSRMVTIDPLAYDWEGQFKLISDELSRP